jgi:broad specificity phosphatase PhoE
MTTAVNPPTTIYLIRHGHVQIQQDVYYGRLPGYRLSRAGEAQVQRVAGYLADKSLAVVYASPLLRARQSAAIILSRYDHQRRPHISRLLNETLSPYDGQPRTFMDTINWDDYSGSSLEFDQPLDIIARMFTFINQIRQRYPGQHVAAVSHGDPIAFFILWASGKPISRQGKLDFTQAGFPDPYPALASISALTYQTAAKDEIPQIEYVRLSP